MSRKILIVGAGFAGVWSALGAARVLDLNGKTADVEITLISPARKSSFVRVCTNTRRSR